MTLLFFRIGARGGNESQQSPILQYMDVARPINAVDETLVCVRLRCSTVDKVGHSIRQCAQISVQGSLSVV